MSDTHHKHEDDYVGATQMTANDKIMYKKYREIAAISWKKSYMDLLLPGILLAVTLIWKDVLNLCVKNLMTYFGIQESAVVASTAFTALVLTMIAFYVSSIKRDIDEQAADLGIRT